jgi:hypothetical protein
MSTYAPVRLRKALGYVVSGCCLVAVMAPFAFAAQGNDEVSTLRSAFLNEAPNKWREYAGIMDSVQGTITYDMKLNKTLKGSRNQHVQYDYATNERCKKLVDQSLSSDDQGGSVLATNSRYAFVLRRKSPRDPYVLTELFDLSKQETPSGLTVKLGRARAAVGFLSHLWSQDLGEVVKNPCFRLQDVEPVEVGGEQLAEIHFDYAHSFESSDATFTPVQGGVLVLDPKRYWCLRSANLRLASLTGTGKLSLTIDLEDSTSAIPLPKRCVDIEDWSLFKDNQALRIDSITDFALKHQSALPSDEEFVLAAYGLPEPFDIANPPTTPRRWYLWLAGAGCLCLVAGAVLYRVRRRV